jgi:hypothetical protein
MDGEEAMLDADLAVVLIELSETSNVAAQARDEVDTY